MHHYLNVCFLIRKRWWRKKKYCCVKIIKSMYLRHQLRLPEALILLKCFRKICLPSCWMTVKNTTGFLLFLRRRIRNIRGFMIFWQLYWRLKSYVRILSEMRWIIIGLFCHVGKMNGWSNFTTYMLLSAVLLKKRARAPICWRLKLSKLQKENLWLHIAKAMGTVRIHFTIANMRILPSSRMSSFLPLIWLGWMKLLLWMRRCFGSAGVSLWMFWIYGHRMNTSFLFTILRKGTKAALRFQILNISRM